MEEGNMRVRVVYGEVMGEGSIRVGGGGVWGFG